MRLVRAHRVGLDDACPFDAKARLGIADAERGQLFQGFDQSEVGPLDPHLAVDIQPRRRRIVA